MQSLIPHIILIVSTVVAIFSFKAINRYFESRHKGNHNMQTMTALPVFGLTVLIYGGTIYTLVIIFYS